MMQNEPDSDGELLDNHWGNPEHRKHRSKESVISYTGIEFRSPEGETLQFVRSGEPLVIRLRYHASKDGPRPIFGIGIETDSGTVISRVSTWLCGVDIPVLRAGDGFIDLCLDSVNLMPGRYFLSMWVGAMGPVIYDSIDRGAVLRVEESDFYASGRTSQDKSVIMMLRCHWELFGSPEENDGLAQNIQEGEREASGSIDRSSPVLGS